MANNAWDRSIINTRERPLSSDINTLQSQLDRSMRDTLGQLFAGRASALSDVRTNPVSGFIGDGFKVRPPVTPGLSVQVTSGIGFQYLASDTPTSISGVSGLDDLSTYKPLPLLATATLTGIPAGPSAGQDRKDIIEVRVNRAVGNPLSRDTLDTLSGVFTSGLVNKTLAFTLDGSQGQVTDPASSTAAISYKVGLAAATGSAVEPSVTPGYVKVATVFSNNGNMTAGITKANIIDQRYLLTPYNKVAFHLSCTVPSGAGTPGTIQAFNGPPGMEVLVYKNAAPSQAAISVYLIGGTGSASACVASGTLLGSTSGTIQLLTNQGVSIGTLNSTQVSQLGNGTVTANAQTFAVGHPYIKLDFLGVSQSGAATGAPPDPMLVDVQGEIIRF